MRLVYEHLTAIPANFTEVEYLESSGTQYIDTDVIPSEDVSYGWEIYAQAVDTGENDYHWFIGTQTPWQMAGTYPDGSQYTFYPGGGNYYQGGSKVSTPAGGNKYGIVQHIDLYTGSSSNSTSITLFARRASNGGVAAVGSKKIFCCKMSKNNILIRDFVPCLDNNNVPCMYDKVEKKAYYNAGSGSFTYGRKIIPVEYIESDENQYIDTGFALTANSTLDFTFSPNEQSNLNLWVCGSYTTNTKLTGFRISSSTSLQGYIDNTSSIDVSGSNIGNKYHCVMNSTKWSVNGTDGTSATQAAGRCNLTIFGWNASSTTSAVSISGKCSAKVYDFKISDNSSLVRDYIPCKDENNVGFLFDKLSHTAYLNAGTGSFTFGKVMPKKKLRLIRDSKRRLPKEFKEVEYLQSSGTQYIDTGYSFNSNTDEIELYYQNTSTQNHKWLFGSYEENATIGISCGTISAPTFWYKGNIASTESAQYNSEHILRYDSTGMSNDGTNLKAFTSYAGTWNLYLFALNNTGTSPNGYYGYGKVWRYTHKRNGVLIRDYIPCLDASNVPCMYDLVEGKAYYNAGTGSFTYGHTITPVEYIQSSGTQYIDTGYIASNTSGFKVDIMPLQATDKYFIGSRPRLTSDDRFLAGSITGPQVYIGWNTNTFANWTLNNVHTVQNNFMNSRTKVLDGTTIAQITSNLSSQGTRTVYLFSANDANATSLDTCRIYGTQISEGSSLVRDYIPVKDENNVGYMFDKVTHSLYANAGTGAFVVGSELKDITRFLKGA